MPTAHLNGIDIQYVVEGDGPPLLYISGSGHTLEKADPVLDTLAERFTTATFDKRGLGRSSIPPGPYTMADYAADAIALTDHLGWPTFRLIGISFGGMVAQEVAVTWPERIERLALLCTSPGGAGGHSFPLHTLAEMPPREQQELGRRLLDSRFTGRWLHEHPEDAAFLAMLDAEEAATAAAPDPERERGEHAQLAARIGHDVWDRLPRVTCPTLVAVGVHDMLAPPENGRRIAGRVADGRLAQFDGGHLFFRYDPAALPTVTDFLRGID